MKHNTTNCSLTQLNKKHFETINTTTLMYLFPFTYCHLWQKIKKSTLRLSLKNSNKNKINKIS